MQCCSALTLEDFYPEQVYMQMCFIHYLVLENALFSNRKEEKSEDE